MLKLFKCNKVIVLFDFENRSGNYYEFLKQARKAFESYNFSIPVSVAIPYRMIENWYLADIEHLSKAKAFLKKNLKQRNFEGTHGKNELKKCFDKRTDYIETEKPNSLIFLSVLCGGILFAG